MPTFVGELKEKGNQMLRNSVVAVVLCALIVFPVLIYEHEFTMDEEDATQYEALGFFEESMTSAQLNRVVLQLRCLKLHREEPTRCDDYPHELHPAVIDRALEIALRGQLAYKTGGAEKFQTLIWTLRSDAGLEEERKITIPKE